MKERDGIDLTELLPRTTLYGTARALLGRHARQSMEEHGIGRPSTYAPTISTIVDRGYVERDEGKRLKPTDIACTVNDLLVEHFANIVDKEFTARMEQQWTTWRRARRSGCRSLTPSTSRSTKTWR